MEVITVISYFVIGSLAIFGAICGLALLIPSNRSLITNKNKLIDFEIETNNGTFHGKLRVKS